MTLTSSKKVSEFLIAHKKQLVVFSLLLLVALVAAFPADVFAGGAESADNLNNTFFKEFYDMVEGAATGYLGRGLAIAGGIVGLAYGAGQGKAMIAGVGVVLAVFGVLGPSIIEGIFTAGLIA